MVRKKTSNIQLVWCVIWKLGGVCGVWEEGGGKGVNFCVEIGLGS